LNLGYAVAEALRSMRRVPLMSTVTVGTISLSLMVFGLFLLITWNVRSELEKVRGMVDVEAYLESGVGESEALRLQARAASISGVADVTYVSSEQARDRFITDFGDSTLLELLGENPLPASLLISVAGDQQTALGVETVARRIEAMEGVDEVVFGQRFVERFDQLVLLLSAISILIGLVVSLASVFVIGNTVKLTVWARRGAIEIMKLVGATDGFVKLPFIIEGTLQGLAGAAIALGILYGLYAYVAPEIGGMSFLPAAVCGAVLLMGALLGGIGSQVSLKQFLEV